MLRRGSLKPAQSSCVIRNLKRDAQPLQEADMKSSKLLRTTQVKSNSVTIERVLARGESTESK
eukprot:5319128-Karenia_brevis.AAC.1